MRCFTRAVLLGLFTGMLLLARGAEKESSALPTAEQILERYGKAIDGQEAFRKHTSQHATGTVEMRAQGIRGTMEVFAARPNKLILRMTTPVTGEITSGYDGEVAWMNTAVTGPILIEGRALEQLKTQADFDHALHDPAHYQAMKVLGTEEFNGEQTYKVRLVHRSGFESIEFFSIETGLQVGYIATQSTPLGEVKATNVAMEYRNFGDLFLPSKTKQTVSGIETIITIDKMEFDTVDPKVFVAPPEVKTLLLQKSKAAKPPTEENKER